MLLQHVSSGKELSMEDALNESNVGAGACAAATRISLIIGSIGAGALLMYLFDPDKGRGRRARFSDQLTSKVNRIGRAGKSKARDLRNRAHGVMHEVGLAGETQDAHMSESSRTGGHYQPWGEGV